MKIICLISFFTGSILAASGQKVKAKDASVPARKVEKIFINLYTDSLKRGQYNYINVDGLMTDGKYQPLDSNTIRFSCSTAAFVGNSVVIPDDFKDEKVTICVQQKIPDAQKHEIVLWIKTVPDPPLSNKP